MICSPGRILPVFLFSGSSMNRKREINLRISNTYKKCEITLQKDVEIHFNGKYLHFEKNFTFFSCAKGKF